MSDEKIKVYFVESTDPYGDRGILQSKGFFDESQANALEAEQQQKFGGVYSHMVQEIYVVFSHRNGEPVSPEVSGFYWVEYLDTWEVRWNPANDSDPTIERCRFWGPIPMPEVV